MKFIKTLLIISLFSACAIEEEVPCFTKSGNYYGNATLIKNDCPSEPPVTQEGYVRWPITKDVRKCGPDERLVEMPYYDAFMGCEIYHIVESVATDTRITGFIKYVWMCTEGGLGYLFLQDPIKHPDFQCDSKKDKDCKFMCEDVYEFKVEYRLPETAK